MNNGFDKNAFFTLRAAAYKSDFTAKADGLGLSDAFQNRVKNYSAAGSVDILKSLLPLDSLYLQLSINKRGSLEKLSNNLSNNEFLPPLEDDHILTQLVKDPSKAVNYFGSLSGLRKRRVDASIYANEKDENYHQKLRTDFANDDNSLNISFTSSKGKGFLLGPNGLIDSKTKDKTAYGTGYQLQFADGFTLGAYNSYLLRNNGVRMPRILSSVESINLMTDANTSDNWNCPQDMRFMIVRLEDAETATGGNCQKIAPDFSSLSPSQKAIFNIFKPERWYVDFGHHCIIPRKIGASCYGKGSQSALVNYGGNITEGGNHAACGGSSMFNGQAVLCPHYASVCHRN